MSALTIAGAAHESLTALLPATLGARGPPLIPGPLQSGPDRAVGFGRCRAVPADRLIEERWPGLSREGARHALRVRVAAVPRRAVPAAARGRGGAACPEH